ncbi:MAG: cytochrome c oxidase subunit 3 family protein [Acidobacteria bacterium]|nr:cytochrome c oxidase subunit 3 family protein [Acidobacteriota bacterium]MBW4046329.1 cytochrome c oxidase subunit 3 family protein [Acidobacteriota bacterium]
MWLFLLTEIMFFGGMFAAYLIYRNWYYPAFVAGSHQLSIVLGTINTAVLIGSSFTMAMAVYSAETRNRKALITYLLLTITLGLVFLGIKSDEYHEKWEKHHVPGLNFSVHDFVNVNPAYPDDKPLPLDMAEKTQVYFSLYFAMTGMHALHMIIGISILIILVIKAYGGSYTDGHVSTIENFGLYWHFVDIVWIFLFPLLYLISRHQ